MRRLIYAMPVVLGLLTIPQQATAQEFKPYLNAGLGGFLLNDGNGNHFVFGGYGAIGAMVTDYLGIEGRFGTTGSDTRADGQANIATTVQNKVDWFASYLLRPQIILAQGLRAYALVGATTLRSSVTFGVPGNQLSKTNTDFTYGVGLQYSPSDNNLYIGVEWARYASSKNHAGLSTTNYDGMDMQGYVATMHYDF